MPANRSNFLEVLQSTICIRLFTIDIASSMPHLIDLISNSLVLKQAFHVMDGNECDVQMVGFSQLSGNVVYKRIQLMM